MVCLVYEETNEETENEYIMYFFLVSTFVVSEERLLSAEVFNYKSSLQLPCSRYFQASLSHTASADRATRGEIGEKIEAKRFVREEC